MKLLFTITFILATIFANAQSSSLRINPGNFLPKDSIALTASLNEFLSAAEKPNEENKFVFEGEKLETFIQLDEINGIEKSGKFKDEHFYKPYLMNVVLLKDTTFLIQVSYVGISENTALLTHIARRCYRKWEYLLT